MAYRAPQDPERYQPGRYQQAGRDAADPPAARPRRSASGQGDAPPGRGEAAGLVLSEEPWAGRLPRVRAHVALVLVYKAGDYEVLWPHSQRRPFGRRFITAYEVDLGLRRAQIEADLPSKGDVLAFHAVIDLQWRARDPAAVVRNSALNVKNALTPVLLRRLRDITRAFDIERSADAETAINNWPGSTPSGMREPGDFGSPVQRAAFDSDLGAEYGLWTRVITRLSVDETTIEHGATMKKLGRDIEVEIKTQELRKLQEENERQIRAARIVSYRDIISAGDMNRFALQLANNPGDVAAVGALIREDEANRRTDTLRFVADMVESGVIEPWEVSDQARETLEWLKRATARVIRGDQRPELEEAAPRPRRRGRDDPGGHRDARPAHRSEDETVAGHVVRDDGEGTGSG
jgi:hypothetical protein